MNRPHLALSLLLAALLLAPLRARAQRASAPPTQGSGQAPAPPISAEAMRQAQARFAHEPPVGVLVDAALRASELDPGRAAEAADRARWSGLLPSLRLGVRRGQAWDLSALRSGESDRTNLSTDDDLVLEARAQFPLGRLLYAPEEAALMRERRAIEVARQERAAQVITLYYERRRLQLEGALAGLRDAARVARIQELGALLDQLTDGALSRHTRASECEHNSSSTTGVE
jgi:hypothetical protein